MKHIFKYCTLLYALLLTSGVLTDKFNSGKDQNRFYTEEGHSLFYSSEIGPGIFAVEPPAQSVARSLHLYPEAIKDSSVNNNNIPKSSGFNRSSVPVLFSSTLFGYIDSISYSFIRSILFPFHSFL